MNAKTFEDKEVGLYKHYFGTNLLDHDISRYENFENVIDILITL